MDKEVNHVKRALPPHSYPNLERNVGVITKRVDSKSAAEELVRTLQEKSVQEALLVFPAVEHRHLHVVQEVCRRTSCLGVVAAVSEEKPELTFGMLIHPLMGVYGIQCQSHLGPTSHLSEAVELKDQNEKWIAAKGYADPRVEVAYRPHVFGSFLGLSVGLLVNEDTFFPENARLFGLCGADVVVVHSKGPEGSYSDWQLQVMGHAICNGYYAFGVFEATQALTEPRTLAFDPEGKVLPTEPTGSIVLLTLRTADVHYARAVTEVYRQRKPRFYTQLVTPRR